MVSEGLGMICGSRNCRTSFLYVVALSILLNVKSTRESLNRVFSGSMVALRKSESLTLCCRWLKCSSLLRSLKIDVATKAYVLEIVCFVAMTLRRPFSHLAIYELSLHEIKVGK